MLTFASLMFTAQLAGTMAAHRLMQAIRAKCSPEEAVDVLKDLPNPLTDDDGARIFYLWFGKPENMWSPASCG